MADITGPSWCPADPKCHLRNLPTTSPLIEGKPTHRWGTSCVTSTSENMKGQRFTLRRAGTQALRLRSGSAVPVSSCGSLTCLRGNPELRRLPPAACPAVSYLPELSVAESALPEPEPEPANRAAPATPGLGFAAHPGEAGGHGPAGSESLQQPC